MNEGGERIAELASRRLDCPLREPFAISGGAQTQVRNVLVTVRLEDGTPGWGECAPFPAFNGETQEATLKAVREAARRLIGRSAASGASIARELAAKLPGRACARAGIEMAVLDAWSRRRGFPLRLFFGGSGDRVVTDVTIPLGSPEHAAAAAQRISRLGIGTLKIKAGTDWRQDADRVIAALGQTPKARFFLDANAGFDASEALRLLRALSRRGLRPLLFEQPVPAADLAGLKAVARHGRVRVAADESAASLADVLRLIRARAADVINIKLMKTGIFESLEIARLTRAAGLGLMIGGLVESRLSMTCAAHLAAGFGGFDFVDLDTPLFFARDPMRGVPIRRGGAYDLGAVRAGIGVRPA